ncbi:MAG: cobalt transporter CbiM [Deltaproteobacteria bacterium]|nr:MAG: cobalt transporter CbiM [Deltaproteobacteria bacterium]
MHIPDGFLDTKTWVTLGVVSAGTVGLALRKASKKIGEKQIPLMGVLAAFIFAAQMLNFPVAGGTSGHFMGGVLAAILLGPLAGVLIMAIVLIIQCLVFQDGGLTALGANIFNMGIIGALVGYYFYLGLSRMVAGTRGMFIGAFIASWLSIVLAAGACAAELAVSGTVPLKVALPAMAGVHGLIGIGEGLITVAVLSLILKARPDLLETEKI